MYRVTQLPNGLTVATAAMPHMHSVSLGVWVGIGSRYEEAELNGACHFIEHMLFKGTRRRTARRISEAVEGIGGYLNAFTSEEVTCIHARAGYRHLEHLLEVLLDMFLNSRFDPVELDKEREVIKEEMAMYLDEPQHQVQELLNATLWPDQPLGRPITGTNRTLDGMGRRQLLACLRQRYVAGCTLIVAAGRLTHQQVVRAAGRYAPRLVAGSRPQYAPAQHNQRVPRVRLFTKQTEQTQLALGIRTCSRHDERRFPLRLLNALLGENMSSRLFQVVREDHGLAYSIYSTPSFFHDAGDLVVSAGLDTDNVAKALRLILAELRRFTVGPPGPTEIRQARDYVIGQMELGEESTENQMNWIGEQLLGYGHIVRPADIKRRLCRVTAAQIRSVACDFFRPEHLNLALVSPLKNTGPLARLIGQLN